MNKDSFFFLFFLFLLPHFLFGQSLSHKWSQKLYLHASGFYYVWFDNETRAGEHLQASLGVKLSSSIGIGIGATHWSAMSEDSSTFLSGLGPHLQFSHQRLLFRLESGFLTNYSIQSTRLFYERKLSLPKKAFDPFFRLQAAVRFWKIAVAGTSIILIPKTSLQGETIWFMNSPVEIEPITSFVTLAKLQLFIGIHLQRP
ncbi:MAG: hypothetical protein AAF587_13540 [Bacteroidota bacterium]